MVGALGEPDSLATLEHRLVQGPYSSLFSKSETEDAAQIPRIPVL